MYHQYFGLNEAPFSIAVNPRYLFMSARHRDALAHLLYGVGAGGGFILLTGEVGTGKTTINRCLLEQLPHDTDIAIILNPALNAMELLATACDELGIDYDAQNHTLKSLTDALHNFLLENHGNGRKTVLMIDEAQHLDFDVLEQIRLLTNLETNSEKLLQIILIGQPELAQLLARPELRQLNQRITARYNLEPLNQSETGAYIHHRLQVAGMAPDREIFPQSVVKGIYRQTRGIPRLINVLCDRILLGAYGRNKSKADMSMLRIAAKEVMGEELQITPGSRWLPGIALGLVVLAGVAWWWQTQSVPNEVAVAKPIVDQVPTAVVAQPAAPMPEPAQTEAPITDQVQPAEAPAVAEPVDTFLWLLPPDAAPALLWTLFSDLPFPGELCDPDVNGNIDCIEGEAATWNELAELDRPLLLDMVTPERFAAATILLGVEGRRAWVLDAAGGLQQIDLAQLAPLWSGRFRYPWHVPAGYVRPLALGDRDPAVLEVAGLFARMDGQTKPLSGMLFNAALNQRVVLFQQAQGLEDDGLVGVKTLLKLNEALAIDPTASAVRARLVVAADDSL